MTRTLLTLVSLLLFLQGYATNVSGLISANTTWTKANSPYIVTGNIAIDTPATLTIEPGVIVRFDAGYKMYVYGRIMADGTAADSITFTSNKTSPLPGDWAGIELFYNVPNDTLVFDYCNFKYGGDATMYVRAFSIKLTNCVFTNNKTGFKNLSWPAAYAYINNCTFERNGTAIYIGGRALIDKNNIGYNDFGVQDTGPNCVVVNNKIYYNSVGVVGAIYIGANTIAYNSSVGIDGRGMVKDNQVWYNKTGLIHRGGGLVENNGFNYNTIAINGNYSVNPGHNLIHNCIRNSTSYDYVNYTIFPADISENYWGATDSTILSNKIYDFYDNLTSGKSTFMPPLQDKDLSCIDTISLPAPITTGVNETIKTLNSNLIVYPNPATDNVNFNCDKRIDMIIVYDMTGKEVYKQQCDNKKINVNTTSFSTGVFTYKVIMENDIVFGKFIKQ